MTTVLVLQLIDEIAILFTPSDLVRGVQQPQRFVGIQLAPYSITYHLLDR